MKSALTAFGAVSVLAMQALAGTNLLGNGSFENPGPGVIPFADWTQQFFGNVLQADNGEAPPLDGDYTCKTFGTFPGPGVQGDTGLIQRVPVTAGDVYTATINVYMSSADPLGTQNLALWLLQWKDASGATISENSATAASTMDGSTVTADEWMEVVVSGTAPANATDVDVFLLFLQFDNMGGSLFWDMASLVQDAPPPQPCNAADIAEPFGVLDLNDITAFIGEFTAGCDG